MAEINKRIALLSTGDEIINGDILDTNSVWIAQALIEQQLLPGRRVTVADIQPEIEAAIHYLLSDHTVLMTIGGLGPTSDDRTRFALANALQRELIFDESSWQHIVRRLTNYGFSVPETNRQQCLFPKGASILPNENGTAAACYLKQDNKHIFMLPGPPREIRPIVENVVIPKLIDLKLQEKIYRQNWLLFGIGEGQLAQQIDTINENENVNIGYRVSYPYIELKLSSNDQTVFKAMKKKIMPYISQFLISTHRQTASEQLYSFLKNNEHSIQFYDRATYGLLESSLLSPKTYKRLRFSEGPQTQSLPLTIEIDGLDDYWQPSQSKNTTVTINFFHNGQKQSITKPIALRGRNTLLIAKEMICWEILKYFQRHKALF